MITRPGTTLLELMIALLISTVLLTLAWPSMLHAHHVLAVRAARAELTSAVAAARSAAILTGGAALTIDIVSGTVWIEKVDGTRIGAAQPLAARYGVTLEAGRSPVVVRYDALGIGRLANASVLVRRGDVVASITVSAYGRVRQ